MSSVGITATRHGLTPLQSRVLGTRLKGNYTEAWNYEDEIEFHHGDCVGGDLEGAHIAQFLGFVTVSHPPTNEKLRAFHPSDRVLPALPYHDRNQAIASCVDPLYGCPDGPRRKGSGTWFTIDYARSIGRKVIVIMPDGTEVANP